MEALWPSDQSLKASTPTSRVQTPENAIFSGRGVGSIPRKDELCRKLEKMSTVILGASSKRG